MTREEAIKWMEETIQDAEGLLDKCSPALKEEVLEQNEVFKIAISALRSTQQLGKPLTLEQLREMDGKPVWVEFIGHPDGTPIEPLWMLVNCRERRLVTDVEYVDWNFEGWLAYSYPPAHIDRSEWISVKERLPKDFDQALVYDGDEHYPIGICHKGESGIWHSDMAYGMGTITHWMPLPEPPEEG